MEIERIIDQLKHIIADELEVNLKLEAINSDISLFEDGLGFDSVIIVEFISLIEERFGFKFQSEELDMEMFANLQVLAEFIRARLTRNKLT
ncbi:MAG: acyl carrier protein [Desulfobacterales bacterium]|nr:acyl carrier protein [Desulfobacterales bacterium]